MWQPPPDPDASAILHEAVTDSREGRPEIALQKFLWFHRNPREYDRGLSAVRLSVTLGYWQELASHYPPAHEAMIRVRDETEVAFRKAISDFNLFYDLILLNERLDQDERTALLLREIAVKDQGTAEKLYVLAEHRLVAAGDFRVCNSFLRPRERLASAAECYQSTRNEEKLPSRDGLPSVARFIYLSNVSTLVALLVLNDRYKDARDVFEQSLLVVDDNDFRTTMNLAMTGHLPSIPQLVERRSR